MKHGQSQDRPASAGDPEVRTDTELSDVVLDTITGGGNDAANPLKTQGNVASSNIEPQPINVLCGKVVSKNFA
jgi:hypothetical protein